MFQVSLREMFVLVAVSALALVSLNYASQTWQALVALIAILAAMTAVIRSLIDRGRHRAFAIGFAVGMVGYLLVVVNAHKFTTGRVDSSEMNGHGNLPTSILLQNLRAGINRSGYYDSNTNELVPNSETTSVTSTSSFGPELVTSTGRKVYYRDDPPLTYFMAIGQLWWALIFGYIGGHFAQFIYRRRTTEQAKEGMSSG